MDYIHETRKKWEALQERVNKVDHNDVDTLYEIHKDFSEDYCGMCKEAINRRTIFEPNSKKGYCMFCRTRDECKELSIISESFNYNKYQSLVLTCTYALTVIERLEEEYENC